MIGLCFIDRNRFVEVWPFQIEALNAFNFERLPPTFSIIISIVFDSMIDSSRFNSNNIKSTPRTNRISLSVSTTE